MKYLLVLLLCLAGCTPANDDWDDEYAPERPTVNVPPNMRTRNWFGEQGQGSCVFAGVVPLLRWQGRYITADRIAQYGDGAGPERLDSIFDEEGVRYAQTVSGDENFLTWALETRRGCGISWDIPEGHHFVDLVYLDGEQAMLLDSNAPGRFITIPRDELITNWKESGGWAITPVYTPAAPLPQEV
jgi:hypothetical protein